MPGLDLVAIRPGSIADFSQIAAIQARTDIALGGPPEFYRELERNGCLAIPPPEFRQAPWATFGLSRWGLASRKFSDAQTSTPVSLTLERLAAPASFDSFSLADTRRDPMLGVLIIDGLRSASDFAHAYASWVRVFGNAASIFPTTHAGLAQMMRLPTPPAATFCVASTASAHGLDFSAIDLESQAAHAMGVLRRSNVNSDAWKLLQTLAIRSEAASDLESSGGNARSEADTRFLHAFLDDLIGATLTLAHPELHEACRVLKQLIAHSGNEVQARASAFLIEAPPWPPASITELKRKPQGDALVEALADQVAPSNAARSWLLASWNSPAKPLDLSLPQMLAQVDSGRLAWEPRFRSWLQAEWLAWARQRYRRVARLAQGGF
jgi:hypothetical protein